MIVMNMATYPDRKIEKSMDSLDLLVQQAHVINLCLNQYREIPVEFSRYKNINAFIPETDYKDVGKFVFKPSDDDDLFYVDDDIYYPKDYVSRMISARDEIHDLNPILGVHGIIYPDVYRGDSSERLYYSFRMGIDEHRVVNQIGTGTTYCKGWQAPNIEYMDGSQQYADVRFAVHANKNDWPLICVKRESNWLSSSIEKEGIYENFTKKWPYRVIREVQSIAGFGKLPLNAVARLA